MNEIGKIKKDLFLVLELDDSKILEYHFDLIEKSKNDGDFRAVSFNTLRMRFLLHKLTKLKKLKPKNFNLHKNDLLSQKDTDGFYGFRFEVDIAFSLLEKGIDFEKSERPDFKLDLKGKNLFIECTSVRSRGGNTDYGNLKKKVIDTIGGKEAKPYSNSVTILAIDVTNVFYNVKPENWQTFYDELFEHVKKHSKDDKYGAILMFVTVFSQKTNQIKSTFCRTNSENIDEDLKAFVEKYFPYRKDSIKAPAIPKES